MAENKLYLDDNVIIPDYIRKMTHEERQKEIARLEAEAVEKKRKIETQKKMPKAV